MNNLQQFDESKYSKTFDYKKYFATMDMSEEERAKRENLARDFATVLLYFFSTLGLADQAREYYYQILEERCKAIAEGYVGKTDLAYLNEWARKFAKKTTDETIDHIQNPVADDKMFHFEEWEEEIPQNEYWTSPLRALLIGGGLAVLIGEYDDLLAAIESGMTTKTWRTELDKRVRSTHKAAEGQTVSIFEPFSVGDSLLMFPKDESLGASEEEICSCRCHAEYF